MFFLVQIKTLTLEPSFIGLIIKGKVNFEFINFKKIFFFNILLYENFKYFGVKILFLINIFLDKSLSIAKAEDKTPEWVYFTFSVSNIDCTYPSSPYLPCNKFKTTSGLNFLKCFINSPLGSCILIL